MTQSKDFLMNRQTWWCIGFIGSVYTNAIETYKNVYVPHEFYLVYFNMFFSRFL